jgi:imidazolonepropionase
MPVLNNIRTLYICPADGAHDDAGAIDDAALAWRDGRITWAGPAAELPGEYADDERHDAEEGIAIPGLVDCHTHLAFGGWRADEFAQRCAGATYLEIARAGGGIARTVEQTRAASEDELTERCRGFLKDMAALGVTTVECKSGYGLNLEDELKQLRVYRRLAGDSPLRIVPTFLGAHIMPPDYRDDREAYIRLLTEEVIPRIAEDGLAEFCDVFVEETAYTVDEARRILAAAREHGLRAKLHADQLSDSGGGALAAEFDAASADHLEYLSEDGRKAMADRGVVAVSLPLATTYLNQKPMDGRMMIDAGIPVAVATDFNPGSSPSFHLPLAMTLACIQQGMSPAESLRGATTVAARALGRASEVGSLEPGYAADFAVIGVESLNHWLYHFVANACRQTWASGRRIQNAGSPVS